MTYASEMKRFTDDLQGCPGCGTELGPRETFCEKCMSEGSGTWDDRCDDCGRDAGECECPPGYDQGLRRPPLAEEWRRVTLACAGCGNLLPVTTAKRFPPDTTLGRDAYFVAATCEPCAHTTCAIRREPAPETLQ